MHVATLCLTMTTAWFNNYCDDLEVGLGSQLSADRIVVPDEAEYVASATQYATGSWPNLSPSGVLYPQTEAEIKTIVLYATLCRYRIVTRSGGHQYKGLSSCNKDEHKCLQIDMSNFSDVQIANTTVTVGAGVSLGVLYDTLAAQGLFVAGGECSGVNVGGHTQTGGYGIYSRSFGFFVDNVVAFDIVLASGVLQHVTKPGTAKNAGLFNDQLFWAVLGGGAGSWGVVVRYYYQARTDAAFPLHTYYSCLLPWNKAAYIAAQTIIRDMVREDGFDDNIDESVFTTILKRAPSDFNVLHVEGVWTGVSGKSFNSTHYSLFQAALTPYGARCVALPLPISATIAGPITFRAARELPLPFSKSVHTIASDGLDDAAMNILATYIDDNMDGSKPLYPFHQLATFAGQANSAAANKLTALPHRGSKLVTEWSVFYNPAGATKADADAYITNSWNALLKTPAFKEDGRLVWGTFGDVNIQNVWKRYFPEDTYAKLRTIKTLVDPTETFRSNFTIPSLLRLF